MRKALAALIASATAALSAACLKSAFFTDTEDVTKATAVAGFALVAAIIAFILVYWICSRRAEKFPVLGGARGALAALATFLLFIISYGLIFPGPLGRWKSLMGLVLLGTGLFGVPVAAVGAITGHFIERVIFRRPDKPPEPAREHG